VRIPTLFLMVCLLLSAFQIQAADPPSPQPGANIPGAELWREVRQRNGEVTGVSQVKSPGANVLINVSGQSWRIYRMEELIPAASTAVLIALACVLIFRILRGKIELRDGRSGVKVLRFTVTQRTVHWSTAILFVLLAVTGMILLFGRNFLIPVIGGSAFGGLAIVAKTLHDYLGPLFMLSLTLLFILFARENIPSPKLDLQWILKGGGLLGKHASSPRYNAGEKGWFWIASLVGLAVIISGMVLDFPIFGQTRETMEFYHWLHSISAVILIVASFGHIYMGTAAMEGTFEVMKTGYCDSNWAKEHHDLWYQEISGESPADKPEESVSGSEKSVT
jgi:formate dehydrogenase subunit gamma